MTSPRHQRTHAFGGRAAVVCALVGFYVALVPARAAARKAKRTGATADVVAACVDNYKTGRDNEQSGRLLQARELFIKCSKAACGSPLREECTTRFTQLSTDIPSVVPMVTDDAGSAQTDVEVKVDGERLTSTLDGHSFVLNPGVREFSFSKDGRIFATQTLMIVQGQRNRLIAASLQATVSSETKAAPARPIQLMPQRVAPDSRAEDEAPDHNLTVIEHASTGPSTLSYVLGGVGLASLGAGALLIVWGRKDNSRLSECAIPDAANCPQSTVDHIHKLYTAGNIALGVGVASLGAAYWAYAHRHQESASEASAGATSKDEAYRFDVQPTRSGAVASVSGAF